MKTEKHSASLLSSSCIYFQWLTAVHVGLRSVFAHHCTFVCMCINASVFASFCALPFFSLSMIEFLRSGLLSITTVKVHARLNPHTTTQKHTHVHTLTCALTHFVLSHTHTHIHINLNDAYTYHQIINLRIRHTRP